MEASERHSTSTDLLTLGDSDFTGNWQGYRLGSKGLESNSFEFLIQLFRPRVRGAVKFYFPG